MKLDQGFIQVYTGNGKGKTTAAIGQAIRAMGAGLSVCFIQFMKDYAYSELEILQGFAPHLKLLRYGNDAFVFKKQPPEAALVEEMRCGLREAERAMISGEYDLVILDEVLVSVYFKLLDVDDIKKIVKKKPHQVELILTGRYCPQEINDLADLVSEIKEIKHYYQRGISARKGIES